MATRRGAADFAAKTFPVARSTYSGPLQGASTVMWGAQGVGTSTTPVFLFPAGPANSAASATTTQFRISGPRTFSQMRVRTRIAGTGTNIIVYTLLVNGVVSAMTVAMAANVQDGSNLVSQVSVVLGDILELTVTKAIAIGSSPTDVMVSMNAISP